MSSFTKPLIVKPLDSRKWELVEEFEYYTDVFKERIIIKVPKGFITDFASTPRILWSVFPPWGRYGKAAVLHDYLYQTAMFDRKTCDLIFKEAMDVLGVGKIKRNLMYLAVRVFGEKHYNKTFKERKWI